MADIFVYADESGNLDYDAAGKSGATDYFGFGTATFGSDHGAHLFEGLRLRADLERRGLSMRSGFHAVNDSNRTRTEMFNVIAAQAPRFDSTFLLKANAYDYVKERGQMYLYKLAWFQHLKYVAPEVSNPGDTLYVVAASFGTAERRTQARQALDDVCNQIDRKIVLCVWDAGTSWGLQVADYGLWATHRVLNKKTCTWYETSIKPTERSIFAPWGQK
ncbi:DUF3800 domain-containing protein [Aeromicrobium sp. 179-A 4D2 NHS]|uniref:DUF3800 domain-containing protein n=1 Tax=Aeromicrobium sp. 179-A 4D2 NHS TaxID=3142375 RepID=UPI00399FB416